MESKLDDKKTMSWDENENQEIRESATDRIELRLTESDVCGGEEGGEVQKVSEREKCPKQKKQKKKGKSVKNKTR